MNNFNKDIQDLLYLTKVQLDDLLSISWPDNPQQREQLINAYLQHELNDYDCSPQTQLNAEQQQAFRLRCVFFACQEVLPKLSKRYLLHAQDHLLQEELILYIQDHLLANNFHRLNTYQDDKNTKFRTYLKSMVHNLAIDFLRKKTRENQIIDYHTKIDGQDDDYEKSIEPSDEKQSQSLEQQQSLNWLEDLFSKQEHQQQTAHRQAKEASESKTAKAQMVQLIASHLNLSLVERLFLKAIYFGDLSAEEAGQLPGIELNKNQANSLHRRLLERLAEVFKESGIYGDLQQMVVELDELEEVIIGDLNLRISHAQFILLIKSTLNCECHVEYQEQAIQASSRKQYPQLRKRLFEYMSDIRSDAMVGEQYLDELNPKASQIKLRLLEQWFEVQSRYRKKIKAIFATQSVN